jgi:flavin reductase (DIM6/NTAB) family NADH-FMN oxidoreductase RutF
MIKKSGVFAISFLDEEQKDLAQNSFSHCAESATDLRTWNLHRRNRLSIISDSLGYVECKVVGAVEQGDHTVFVGEVIASGVHREGKPLLLENTGWQYGG